MLPKRTAVLLGAVALSLCCIAFAEVEVQPDGSVAPSTDPPVRPKGAIQLVRPVSEGSNPLLEVTPEGMALLRDMTSKLQVVGVVGPFHSGKSFLLNQLMGKQRGFKTGTSVEPTTKGIWAWTEPQELSPGTHVLYLDTEGFGASDVTADYDAKIFAVASLFSGLLMYNSVQNIDQSSIDYLELLARRTQLFQLKTAVSEMGPKAEMNPTDLFPLPSMIWVVEDFFMNPVNDETPSEWLHRLLTKPRKDGGGAGTGSGITDVFPSVECHTLYLPVLSREGLSDVSSVDPDQLTSEFTEGVTQLRKRVAASLSQITHVRNGPSLASLLEVLIQAVNSGKLSDVPSLWDLFVERQLHEAIAGATKCFDIGVDRLTDVRPPTPIHDFTAQCNGLLGRCSKVFKSMLLGVDNATAADATTDFNLSVGDELQAQLVHQNRSIDHFCSAAGGRMKDSFREYTRTIELPTKSSTFQSKLQASLEQAVAELTAELKPYGEVGERYVASARAVAEDTLAHALLVNREKHRQVMDAAVAEAHQEYNELVADRFAQLDHDEALIDSALEALDTAATIAATQAYEAHAKVSVGEADYQLLLGTVTSGRPLAKLVAANDARIRSIADRAADRLAAQVTRQLLAVGPLPMALESLVDAARKISASTMEMFDDEVQAYKSSSVLKEYRDELQATCSEITNTLKLSNDKAWQRVFHRPLKHAKEVLRAEAKSSWSSFLLRRTAAALANEKIMESEEGRKVAAAQRARVVEGWLNTQEVSAIISSVDVWQNIVIGAVVAALLVLFGLCRCGRK